MDLGTLAPGDIVLLAVAGAGLLLLVVALLGGRIGFELDWLDADGDGGGD
ncbi:hypothetical protein [Salinarimonas chemoclinalis]